MGKNGRKRVLGLIETVAKERTNRLGRNTEARFLEAVSATESKVKMPDWITGFELTKPWSSEDRDKIDVIVTTDIGKLFLQIKSSERGASGHFKKFTRRDARKKIIGVLVIRTGDTIEEIRGNTRRTLENIYHKLVEARAWVE